MLIAPDEGGDGKGWTYGMQGGWLMNIEFLGDMSHGHHNNCGNAMRESNEWAFILLMTLVYNCPALPWQEERFQKATVEPWLKIKTAIVLFVLSLATLNICFKQTLQLFCY